MNYLLRTVISFASAFLVGICDGRFLDFCLFMYYLFVLYGCVIWFATLKEEHRLEGVCKMGAEESILT
jgi:hypothetical protein